MSMINEFVEKLRGRLKKELQLADEDKRKADVLQFDRAVGYANGMAIAIDILNQLEEQYKDVHDTNVGKNLSENLIEKIKFGIEASNINDDYTTGLRNGMRYCLALIDGKEPKFESCRQGWIPCRERLPECDNKYGWVSCIVSVIRSHYPTSSYDICDSPYDENIVMHADYHVSQKIWHLDCHEQLNALMDIEDSPLNGDYVVAWKPLPEPYKGE